MNMVIYEVNVNVNKEIYNEYYKWLITHMDEMLKIDGFSKVEIGLVENPAEEGKKKVRVSYTIDTYENLQKYLTQHAPKMRSAAIEIFGDKFHADRRIILEPLTLEA
jgi:hypothetical protein